MRISDWSSDVCSSDLEKWMDWMGMGVEEQGPEMDLFRHVRERLLTGVEASQSLGALYDGQDRLQYANKAFRNAFSMRDGYLGLGFETIVRKNHELGPGVLIRSYSIKKYAEIHRTRRRQ